MKIVLKTLRISKKNLVLSSLIMLIAMISLVLLFSFYVGIRDMIDKEINNKYINRDYITRLNQNVNVDDEINEISNLNYVEISYKNYPALNLENDDYGFISLEGVVNDAISRLVYDENYLEDNYIILPSCFGNEKLIGNEILLKYKQETFKFVIAGIYYLDEDVVSNRAYTSITYYENIIKNNSIYESSNEIHIVLNNSEKYIDLLNDIQGKYEEMYLKDSSGVTEKNLYKGLESLLFYFIIGIIVFLLITLLIILNIIINYEYEGIAILKSVGYTDLKIYSLISLIFFIIVSIIYFVISIFSIIFIYVGKILFDYKVLSYVYINLKTFLVIYIMIILFLLATILFNYFKIRKISIIKLMNES